MLTLPSSLALLLGARGDGGDNNRPGPAAMGGTEELEWEVAVVAYGARDKAGAAWRIGWQSSVLVPPPAPTSVLTGNWLVKK